MGTFKIFLLPRNTFLEMGMTTQHTGPTHVSLDQASSPAEDSNRVGFYLHHTTQSTGNHTTKSTGSIVTLTPAQDRKFLGDMHSPPLISCNLNTMVQSQWSKPFRGNYFYYIYQCSSPISIVEMRMNMNRILVILLYQLNTHSPSLLSLPHSILLMRKT